MVLLGTLTTESDMGRFLAGVAVGALTGALAALHPIGAAWVASFMAATALVVGGMVLLAKMTGGSRV